ncbi:bactofilin family protein [Hydrogenophaga sp. BPS33]|uniref:bactofilin family protein n=1 Tax=Hydrogenophaga sp. BPS33 TaxID=2651974 RepID=UPI0013204880|nr:polymer-forming cytoskeletal protein [Hydrogenophaga sp. BPS33]QHE87178.1 polymer-forming cytoskeletal protein [Hydrogenophaga sp. BPS33]
MSERNDQKGTVVIGEGVSISGVLKVPGRAVIHGDFQGELYAEELTLGLAGTIAGKTHVGKADVQGEIRDELLVTGHLIVRASGRIQGHVAYGEVEVERGGNIQGALRQGKPEAKEVPVLNDRLLLLGDKLVSLNEGEKALE